MASPVPGVPYLFDAAAGVFVAPGRASLRPDLGSIRDSLVYGSYLPEVGPTAGLLDAGRLTAFNAAATQTVTLTDGGVYQDLIIYGDVRPPTVHTADVVLRNCLLRGGPHVPANDDAVVQAQATRTGAGKLILIDCEISPQLPALKRDGVRGNRVELHRCYVHDTIDGVNLWASPSQNGGASNSGLYGSVIERLRYGNPDGQHADGTHNDCVSINGGRNIVVRGNLLNGTGVDLPGTLPNPTHPQIQASGWAYGSCIIVTNTVGNPPDASVVIEENWLRGCNAHYNIKANMAATVANNRHYRAVFVGSTSSGYWARYDQRAGNGVSITTDTWVDGPYAGQLLSEPRDRGIHFNT